MLTFCLILLGHDMRTGTDRFRFQPPSVSSHFRENNDLEASQPIVGNKVE